MVHKIFRDPVKENFVISAPQREKRPFQETSTCPFCPGAEEVPTKFSGVKSLPNKYPALIPEAPQVNIGESARGFCDVILYSSSHDEWLWEKSVGFITKVIQHWKTRSEQFSISTEFVRYVFPFESFGREIGVSLDHPHGQLFALPFVPPVIQTKKRHLKRENCEFCSLQDDFITITSTSHFQTVFPIHARWPLEINIIPRSHISHLSGLTDEMKVDLARCLKQSLSSFYSLYNKPIPYMLSVFQGEINPHGDFHLHVELISPQITATKIKYRATLESSLDVFINSVDPNKVATKLQKLMQQ